MSCIFFRTTALASALLFSITALAQRAPRPSSIQLQVNGQIRYAQGSRPAELILVRLESFGGGIEGETTTDRSGKFVFTGLRPELYIVSARTAGFREVQQQVDLRTQATDYVQLQLVAEDETPDVSSRSKRSGVIDANVPNDARAELEKGRDALLQANNVDEGILHLENALKIYPKYFEAMLLLGTAYMDKNDWDKAEVTLKRVCELEPKIANAWFALGELHIKQKKNEEAEKVLLEGLQIEDRSYQGHLGLGRVYWNMAAKFKDEAHYRPLLEKSYEQAKRALELKPDLANAHLLKGNLLFKARRPEDALREFEEYVRLEPNGPFADQTRALVERIKKALAEQKKS